ncbi:MAG TPA: phosphate ABC transporter permease subunit PstC [Microbacteriaceae bacterium]|nr:phosphate ABC transporter permease subunit PstC [Microbacteriaceae bacterium]
MLKLINTGNRRGDRIFSGLTLAAAAVLVLVLGSVAVFLITQSIPAFTANETTASLLDSTFWAYALPLLFGTVWVSVLALIMAVPVSIGIALFITHFAPRRLAGILGSLIDLLAAVPSVVFGLWGVAVLAPALQPVFAWLVENVGWFPLFEGPVSATGRTILTAAVVLAVMILPIITSLTREVFKHTPKLSEEGALALGATKWEMITMTVLPFGRSGILSASMLGLGRALGETMAVTMVLSATGGISWQLLTSQNPSTIAANIALTFPEAYQTNINVLIATGLMLFAVTFLVSAVARLIVRRLTVA